MWQTGGRLALNKRTCDNALLTRFGWRLGWAVTGEIFWKLAVDLPKPTPTIRPLWTSVIAPLRYAGKGECKEARSFCKCPRGPAF